MENACCRGERSEAPERRGEDAEMRRGRRDVWYKNGVDTSRVKVRS